jgi:hypothetical protein
MQAGYRVLWLTGAEGEVRRAACGATGSEAVPTMTDRDYSETQHSKEKDPQADWPKARSWRSRAEAAGTHTEVNRSGARLGLMHTAQDHGLNPPSHSCHQRGLHPTVFLT